MSEVINDLTVTLARAADEARLRLVDEIGEALAWVLWVLSGAANAKGCVVCDSRVETERHHVAGRRHGELVVPVCGNCHRRLSEGQNGWDPRWRSDRHSLALDDSLLIRGLAGLCEERGRYFGSPYHDLAKRLQAAYAIRARETS